MHCRQLLVTFLLLCLFLAPLPAQAKAITPVDAVSSAYWDQNTQQREPWNLGERQPNWIGSSTLTIENRCKSQHQFEVVPNDLPFVQIQASAQNLAVGGHQTKQLPVKFDTTGIAEGEHVGQVVVRCLDCSKEPGCTQDKEFIPVRMVIAKNTTPTQPPPPPPEPQTKTPTQSQTPPPMPPPPSQPQSCGQSVEQPAPDLLSLLNYKGYSAKITELSPEAGRQWQTFMVAQPQLKTLAQELNKKGYIFPPNSVAHIATVELKQGGCSAALAVGSFRSNPKPDGTVAGITVAYNRAAPEQSLFQAHITNVYALQPEEMPANNPTIRFNNESWFTVQIGEVPAAAQFISPFWPVIWYRYWWYDSHRHPNWYYGCYQWWWWRYRWYGRPWFWWYNWWWGYYYWWNWNYWSTWWAPLGYQGLPPE